MAELKKHAWLLSILFILAIVKFIVTPAIEWQNEILADIQLLEKKKNKVANVLAKRDKSTIDYKKLSAFVEQGNKVLFPYQQEAAFKLSQQKALESLLTKHNLRVQNIGWQVSTIQEELSVIRYSIQIRFSGESINAIKFMAAIESQEYLIDIKDFNVSLKGQKDQTLGRIDGQVSLYLYVTNSSDGSVIVRNNAGGML